MSDLTRRVLDWASANTDEHGCFYPMSTLAIAAPILARQVEAVEALADRLDAEAERLGPRGGGFTARAFAAEIRDALNNAEKGNTP